MRHGETDDNAAGIWQGHRDSRLSATGREQARLAAPVLAALRPSVVVSSDLRRAADTADAVAARLGVPVTRDARLREIDVGRWGGRTAAEVRESDPATLLALSKGIDARRGHSGETVAELALRARAAADEVVAALAPGQTGLIVCHGITSRALVASLVGLDQMQAGRVLRGLDNCHWARVSEAGRAGGDAGPPPWRIEQWNIGGGAVADEPAASWSPTDLGGGHANG